MIKTITTNIYQLVQKNQLNSKGRFHTHRQIFDLVLITNTLHFVASFKTSFYICMSSKCFKDICIGKQDKNTEEDIHCLQHLIP